MTLAANPGTLTRPIRALYPANPGALPGAGGGAMRASDGAALSLFGAQLFRHADVADSADGYGRCRADYDWWMIETVCRYLEYLPG